METARMRTTPQWVNITETTKPRLAALRRKFPAIDPQDLADCLPPQQRPKFVDRGTYRFLILLLPRYHRAARAIETEEVDCFVFPDTVITVHSNGLPVLREFAARRTNAAAGASDTVSLLCDLLEDLLEYCSPILVHLQNDIDEQERRVREHGDDAIDITRTSLLRRNVSAFCRTFAPNTHAIRHLRDALEGDVGRVARVRLDRLLDAANEILLLLDDYRLAITDIHETQQALAQHRTGRVTTALTILAVLTFPISMIASIFGIGAVGTPFIEHQYGFWILVAGLAAIALGMLGYFKARKWV